LALTALLLFGRGGGTGFPESLGSTKNVTILSAISSRLPFFSKSKIPHKLFTTRNSNLQAMNMSNHGYILWRQLQENNSTSY
jgi:hypothetical protein